MRVVMRSVVYVACCSFPVLVSACGLIPSGSDAAPLPPEEAFIVPKPSDVRSNTLAQAACVDGNTAITDLESRIDGINATLASDLALLRALRDASPSTQATITTYEATSDGHTLSVQLVQQADDIVITGIEADRTVVQGTYKSDGSQGALEFESADGTQISSAWSAEGDGLKFARTEGTTQTAVNITGTEVQLAVTDGADTLAAHWDRDTRAGELAVSNGTPSCWSAGTNAADMCNVACGS